MKSTVNTYEHQLTVVNTSNVKRSIQPGLRLPSPGGEGQGEGGFYAVLNIETRKLNVESSPLTPV